MTRGVTCPIGGTAIAQPGRFYSSTCLSPTLKSCSERMKLEYDHLGIFGPAVKATVGTSAIIDADFLMIILDYDPLIMMELIAPQYLLFLVIYRFYYRNLRFERWEFSASVLALYSHVTHAR